MITKVIDTRVPNFLPTVLYKDIPVGQVFESNGLVFIKLRIGPNTETTIFGVEDGLSNRYVDNIPLTKKYENYRPLKATITLGYE